MEQREGILRSQEALMDALKGHNVTPLQSYKYLPYMAMEVTEGALRALVDSGAIATIEEDVLAEPTLSGTIPIVGADDAHALGFTGSGQTVAILDTGIEGLHSFFGGRIVSEACYSNAGPSSTRRSLCPSGLQTQLGPGAAEATTGQCFDGASNLCRHGSHVAGIAAGNGSSFTGVAKNSNIIAIQVFTRFNSDSDCGSGRSPCVLSYRSDQIKGLERVYALRSAYNIAAANMSLGGGAYTSQAACDAANSSTKAAIDLLRSAGIATVISRATGASLMRWVRRDASRALSVSARPMMPTTSPGFPTAPASSTYLHRACASLPRFPSEASLASAGRRWRPRTLPARGRCSNSSTRRQRSRPSKQH